MVITKYRHKLSQIYEQVIHKLFKSCFVSCHQQLYMSSSLSDSSLKVKFNEQRTVYFQVGKQFRVHEIASRVKAAMPLIPQDSLHHFRSKESSFFPFEMLASIYCATQSSSNVSQKQG